MSGDLSGSALARWRADPASFIEAVLVDPETGKPFVLLPAERTFIRQAFATGPDGRLLYTEWVYSAPKKSGKTGFAALLTVTVVLLFGGRFGEAFALANDLEQSTSRVFTAAARLIEASPLLRGEARVLSDRIIFTATGGSIVPLASDAASAAGGHPVISVFDELWGFTSERSYRLWDEMVPVPTRKFSARLTVTYAGFSGESTLLEELYTRGRQQPEIAPDLHAGDGILMLWSHVPIAPWQDAAWLANMRRSLRPAQYSRMIENRFVGSESTFIDMAWWDECVDPEAAPVFADRAMSVWLGVDASVKRDSTAIVAVTWDSSAQKVRLLAHRIFQPSIEEPLDFEATVEATIINLSKRFYVREVKFDPYQMQSTAQRLIAKGIPMVEFPQSVPNLTEASQNLYELIKAGNLVVYPDEHIRLAISRAVAIETPRGWRIGKDKQTHKIDVGVALGMAALGAVQGGIAGQAIDWGAALRQVAGMQPYRGYGRHMQACGGGYGRVGRGNAEPAPGRLERQIAANNQSWRR
jgi:Phage Terminase